VNPRFSIGGHRLKRGLFVLAIALLATGCNGGKVSRGPEGAVTGRVITKGSLPSGTKIVFEHREKGIAAEALLAPDGSFSLPNVLAGKNAVMVVAVPPPLPEDANAPAPKSDPEGSIPVKYASAETSGLSADVKEGPNSFEFEIR